MIKIIEDIIDESKSNERKTRSLLTNLVMHMLKCKYQYWYPDKKSWRRSILGCSRQLDELFSSERSLYKNFYLRKLDLEKDIYRFAVASASNETDIQVFEFPKECEWTKKQLSDFDFINQFIAEYGQDYNG